MNRLYILIPLAWIAGQTSSPLSGQSVPPPSGFPPVPAPPAFSPPPLPAPPGPAPFVPANPGNLAPVPAEPAIPAQPGLFQAGSQEPLELSGVVGLDFKELRPFRLRKADANMLLDMIQQHTGWHILRVTRELPAMEINFNSDGPLTRGETIRVVESLLAMHGIGISKISEKFYKAVRAEKINMHVPIWLEGEASAIKPSQKIYMKMFHLKYAPVVEVVKNLTPFKTEVGQMVPLENSNSILVTDALLNLQRMEKLLEALDRPISTEELGTKFHIWTTRHAGAQELERKLKGMIEGSLKPFLGGTTQVDSDERTGKLIIVTRAENLETIDFILETLDAPVKMKTTSKLYKLQHAESKDIQAILDEVIKNQQRIKQQVQGRNAARPNTQAATGGAKPNATPAPAAQQSTASSSEGGGEGAHEFSDFITISSDERSNAILVYGTREDIEEVGRMIESLDHPLPLARIDTIFVMVDLAEQNSRGIDALFKELEWSKFARGPQSENLFGDPITENQQVTTAGPDGLLGTADDVSSTVVSNVARNTMQGVLAVPGLNSAVPFQLEDWELTGIRWDQIFALSTNRDDVRIFSTPSLMVSHNANDVHILIEDERNIVVPQVYAGSSANEGSAGTGQTQAIRAQTSLQIKKPKIGLPLKDEHGNVISKGSVFMEVELKAEKFDETVSNSYQGQNIPARKIREAKSFVTLRDGEVIVLGGLQEIQVDSSESRYNLLSDIPFFGKKFFRPKTVKYTPTELMIFLRPTIIDPAEDKTRENVSDIDKRIDPDYSPKFISPTGRVLGMPDLDGKRSDAVTPPDLPSERPKL